MNIAFIRKPLWVLSLRLGAMLCMGCLGRSGNASPVFSGSGSDPGDNTGLGYLSAPSLSPGHILRPSSIFVLPVLGAKGAERLDFDFHWGNVWNYQPDEFMIDGEWIRSSLRYSYALKDTLSVGLAVPIIGRTGGFADSTIESFHNAFKLGNGERDSFPQNKSRIILNAKGESYPVAEGESWGIGDVSAFVAMRITEGTRVRPAITVQGEVFLPSGDQEELRGMGAPAIALSSVASKRLGGSSFISFLGLGFQYCDSDNIGVIEFRDEQFSGLAGLEYQWSKSFCLLVQYLISSPVAKDYYAFSEPSHEVSAGVKWRAGHDSALELAVVENVAVFQNSADIGIHLAFGRSL